MKASNAVEPIKFPIFEKAQIDWRPAAVDWEAVIDESEPLRQYFLEHFDDPENRLRSKNPKPFQMVG